MVNVLAVGTRVGEALQTLLALVGLFPAVQPLVLRQVVLVLEGLGTVFTLIRPHTCEAMWNKWSAKKGLRHASLE